MAFRPALQRATISATNGSPSVTAASAPFCRKGGTHDVLYSIMLNRASVTHSGVTIQPMRQPVIAQLLEKLFTTMSGSSGSAMSMNEGATARS